MNNKTEPLYTFIFSQAQATTRGIQELFHLNTIAFDIQQLIGRH
jgi:hypothetical protein